MTRPLKRWLLLAAVACLVVYLCWYGTMDYTTGRRAIRAVTAPLLDCPVEQIEVGWGNCTDTSCQHKVRGCGRTGLVDCSSWRPVRRGWLHAYFTFEHECAFYPPRPDGKGFSRDGQGFRNGVPVRYRRE